MEMLPRIIPAEDEEVAALQAAELQKQGVRIQTGVRVEKVAVGAGGVTATLADGSAVTVSKVLVSIGRRFNTGGLGLAQAGGGVRRPGGVRVHRRRGNTPPGGHA